MWSPICEKLKLKSTDKLFSELVAEEQKDTLHKNLISIGILIK